MASCVYRGPAPECPTLGGGINLCGLVRLSSLGGSELMNQALCPTWLGGAESRGRGVG